METHKKVLKEVEFTNKKGEKVTRKVISYERTQETQRISEEIRLGHLKLVTPTFDPTVQGNLNRAHLIWICPHYVAEKVIATRLAKDERQHKVLNGAQLLEKYLDQDGKRSNTLLEGFPAFDQLFLLFGYFEAGNRYIPSLINQLMGQRYHEKRQCWLFIPTDLMTLAQRSTPVIRDLSYVRQIKLSRLVDYKEKVGPEAIERVPEAPSGLMNKQSLGVRKQEEFEDPKLGSKKRKR